MSYQTDPAYRGKCVQASADWYAKNRRVTAQELTRRPKSPMTLEWRGQSVRCFTIGELAAILGRTTWAVLKWEDDHVIPPVTMRTSAGWRLYTEFQVDLLRTSFLEAGLRTRPRGTSARAPLVKFAELVWARWKRIPTGMGEWRDSPE